MSNIEFELSLLGEEERKFYQILKDGETVQNAALAVKWPYAKALNFAKSKLGWDKSWRSKTKISACYNTSSKKVTMNVDEMSELYDQGLSQAEIARRAGDVSRERVRQILMAAGKEPARVKAARKRQQRAAQKEARKAQRALEREKKKEEKKQLLEKRWAPAVDAWDDGKSLTEIAAIMNLPKGSLNWWVGKLRKDYDWFPKRREYTRKK